MALKFNACLKARFWVRFECKNNH